MGIMHKLLKQRDLECQGFIMDLTKSKDNNNRNCKRSSHLEDNDIHEEDLVPKLATEDNQFTAEHIVQLCRFLAEKAKRNNLSHNKHSPYKLKSRVPSQRESNSIHESVEDVNHRMAYSRLHDNDIPRSTSHVLADKFSSNSNASEKLHLKSFPPSNKHRCAQEKRNILLKIRNQIFERKRQRQMMEQQIDVWRPW